MAVTSLWRVKGYVGKVVMYAMNPEKTTETVKVSDGESSLDGLVSYVERDNATNLKSYVYGIKCAKDTVTQDMMAVKNRFGKTDGVIAYHGYQSFAEGEVTPETAHEIGKKLAHELWGDRYQVLVTTHLDKESHIHNHFVINTVSYVDGKKFHRTNEDYRQMRKASDRLCKEYGLSVVREPKKKAMNYAEWRAENEGKETKRGWIRRAIDIATDGCENRWEFLDAMEQMGFTVDLTGKHPKVRYLTDKNFFRFASLGEGYSYGEILDKVDGNYDPTFRKYPEQESPKEIFRDYPGKKVASMSYTAVYHCYNKALEIAKARPMENRALYGICRMDLSIAESYSDQIGLLAEHHIENEEELQAYRKEAVKKIEDMTKFRQDMRNALKRAKRAGDTTQIGQIEYNIQVGTIQLRKLRREVAACDSISERMYDIRSKLQRVEDDDYRGETQTKKEGRNIAKQEVEK